MRKRTNSFIATGVYGVVLTVIALVAFSTVNAGIDPQMFDRGDVYPAYAAMVGFGSLGFFHSIAIIFFSDDDAVATDGGRVEPRISDSFTGFIRQEWHRVFAVSPISAALAAASVFIWHAVATDQATSGTVWGDYSTSPLPAFAVFLALWTTGNICFTIAACAEAFHRNRSGLFAMFLVAMFIVALEMTACFLFLPTQPTGGALIVTAIACPLSLLALGVVRSWAMVRLTRWDATHPAPKFQPGTPYPDGPPFDMLQPGEKLLMQFKSERTPEPQLLIATNQRFVRASILGLDRTFILEQASPGQLTRVTSERVGHDLTTVAHFRDRQVMRIVGGDPQQSRTFAEVANRLARTRQTRL